MSCRDCEEVQDKLDLAYPVRIGAANVEIIACPVHAAMTIDLLWKGDAYEKEHGILDSRRDFGSSS